jgi:hypothetical protein
MTNIKLKSCLIKENNDVAYEGGRTQVDFSAVRME